MTWIIREGKLIEKPSSSQVLRSDLPCPNVIRDGLSEPLQHQANGRWYDSKRAMQKADREAGVICIGNETPKLATKANPPPFEKEDVVRAYEMVKQGYKPDVIVEPISGKEAGWT